jgi:hypothetical protein
VLAFSALRAPIWGSHIEAPYKKQQLKKAVQSCFIYGGPAAGQLCVLALHAAAAAAESAHCKQTHSGAKLRLALQ